MNKLDTDEIFNSFFEKDNNGDYDNSGIKQKDNPNPLLNMTYENLCVLRSYLTDIISDFDTEINQNQICEDDDRIQSFISNHRDNLCGMINKVDEEWSRRDLTDKWRKV